MNVFSVLKKTEECACGKLKGVFYKNQVCELCGVQVTTAKSRRERMGHIELAAPISHNLVLQRNSITYGTCS